MKVQALNMCCSSLFLEVAEDSVDKYILAFLDFSIKKDDYLYIIQFLPEYRTLDLCTIAMTSQHLSLAFQQVHTVLRNTL